MENILLVEDYDFIRTEFKTKMGTSVILHEADDEDEALIVLRKQPITTIIVDFTLRYTNPMDFMKSIKDKFPKIRIFGFLFKVDEEFSIYLKKAGFFDWIIKEDTKEEILKKLSTSAKTS